MPNEIHCYMYILFFYVYFSIFIFRPKNTCNTYISVVYYALAGHAESTVITKDALGALIYRTLNYAIRSSV